MHEDAELTREQKDAIVKPWREAMEGPPIMFRCRVCGMDVTDPAHAPMICETVAHDICKWAS